MKSKFFDSGCLVPIIFVIIFLCALWYTGIFDSKNDDSSYSDESHDSTLDAEQIDYEYDYQYEDEYQYEDDYDNELDYEYGNDYNENSYSSTTIDHDCSDFDTQEDAQLFFEANGGPYDDPHDLDRDGDGMACDWNP